MVIQLLLLEALHVHPVEVLTLTLPEPAEEENVLFVGDMLYVQDTLPSCVTVKVFPAMVIVPVRELVPEFDDTE